MVTFLPFTCWPKHVCLWCIHEYRKRHVFVPAYRLLVFYSPLHDKRCMQALEHTMAVKGSAVACCYYSTRQVYISLATSLIPVPSIWHPLPSSIRKCNLLTTFKHYLKHFAFSWFSSTLWLLVYFGSLQVVYLFTYLWYRHTPSTVAQYMHTSYGLGESVLPGSHRSRTIVFNNAHPRTTRSTELVVLYGMSQGSVLRPILFLLYTAGWPAITAATASLDAYADDTRNYGSRRPSEANTLQQRLSIYIDDLLQWMMSNNQAATQPRQDWDPLMCIRSTKTAYCKWPVRMASRISFYSKLAISLIRFADINI